MAAAFEQSNINQLDLLPADPASVLYRNVQEERGGEVESSTLVYPMATPLQPSETVTTTADAVVEQERALSAPALSLVNDRLSIQERSPRVREKPSIRPATSEDIDALTKIELAAYPDVYGKDPDEQTRASVREKYRQRVELLADAGLIKVIENSTEGPYGMIVICTTNQGPDAFLADGDARDMTQNANIQDVYDRNGMNAYIVNLAVEPGHGRQNGQRLMLDAMQMGIEREVENVFFESRLPGFDDWYRERQQVAANAGRPFSDADIDSLKHVFVDEYWRQTRPDGQPLDPLLAYYVRSIGARPLGLIKDAWSVDKPSAGYGLLCQLTLPAGHKNGEHETGAPAVQEADLPGPISEPITSEPQGASESSLPTAVAAVAPGAMQRTRELVSRHGRAALLLGSAAIVGYLLKAHGQEAQLMEQAQGPAKPWLAVWAGSMAVYSATGVALGMSSAAYTVERAAQKIPFLRDHIPERIWGHVHNVSRFMMEKAFALNAIAAVAAGGAAVGVVATGLPAGEAQTVGYTAVLADLFVTVASRGAIRKVWKSRGDSAVVAK